MQATLILFFIITCDTCDFSSQNYFNLKAENKMKLLWDKIDENYTSLSYYSALTL